MSNVDEFFYHFAENACLTVLLSVSTATYVYASLMNVQVIQKENFKNFTDIIQLSNIVYIPNQLIF